MPAEEERYAPPPSWVQEQASRAAVEQFARDQVELSHARDSVREITDAERDQLRAAKEAAAMPSETSNAPATLRVGVRPPVGNYQRVRLPDHGQTAAFMDEEIHEYVRRDLAVPTVVELAGMVSEAIGRELATDPQRIAAGLHAGLLSRIEGDDDA
jgi:hypothetical protein